MTYGVRSAGITRLYTHDDRFGPYARMVWLPQSDGDAYPRVRFAPKEKGFERYETPATIYNALVPLYPKLRLTATDMVEVATELFPLMRQVAGQDFRDSVTLDMRYVLAEGTCANCSSRRRSTHLDWLSSRPLRSCPDTSAYCISRSTERCSWT